MDALRSYFLSVLAVCMIAVLANALVKHSGIQKVVRLISGILIVLVVVSPLLSVDIEALGQQLLGLTDAKYEAQEVEQAFQTQLRRNIKETTQRYIEDRANALGAYVQAEVTLSDEQYPVPIAVRIVGSLNYQQLTALQSYVTDSLGIQTQQQEWDIYDAP